MRRLPTFSALPRATICRASCVLPAADSMSDDAESGTVMHAFLHRVGELRAGGAEPEDARAAAASEAPEDERDFLLAVPVESLPTDPEQFAGEVALAFDAATGKARELGRNIGRRYEEAAAAQGVPLAATEFCGSLDVVALAGDDGVFCGDWKKRGRYVKPARQNAQVLAGLVAGCRAWGRARGIGEVIRIYEDGRPPYRDRADFNPAAIEQAAIDMTLLAARIFKDRSDHAKGAEIPAVTGSHCRYCPSFQWCPANAQLARRVAEPAELREAITDAPLLSRETAPAVRRRLVQAKAVLREVEDALDAFASQEAAAGRPLELEPGLFYAPVPRNRETIDGAKAEAIIRAELGTFAAEAIEIDVTKSGLGRAIRKKMNGARGVTKAEEEILEKLRKAGAVKKTTSYSCDEVRAKKALSAAPSTEAA